jgi:hypothetical protein
MNRIRSLITIGAFSLLALGLPAMASAQWRDQNRNDDYGYGRYGRNIRGTIQSLEKRARNFDRHVSRVDDRRDDRSRDRWGRDRNDRFDSLDILATRFKNAAENLADEFGRGRNVNASRDEAQRVLSLGSQIDQIIYNSRGGRGSNVQYLEAEWRQIDSDLSTIARAYGLNYTSRNGGWRNRVGFPLPF